MSETHAAGEPLPPAPADHAGEPAPKRRRNLTAADVALFSVAIFSSAYLLFQVQPLISKYILPWFGGSPAVWTACMLFFQSILFGGYLYSHLITRHLPARQQGLVHAALLVVSALAASYILPGDTLRPTGDEDPVWRIVELLALSVGLPFFTLATTGPLLQFWFVRASHSGSVFRLYALSNFGSFLALLSFPFVFEPVFTLVQMGRFWTYGYWAFALLCAAVAVRSTRLPLAERVPDGDRKAATATGLLEIPAAGRRMLWVALPALASLAFIATTDHVSHDVAPEPRLWISTLSLYLLTFIICFDHSRWYRRRLAAVTTLAAIVLLSGRSEIPEWFGYDPDFSVTAVRWMHLAAMFLICFLCHGELYRLRPGNPRYLTEFYLLMSLGGACGGLFVALVATSLFPNYYEWSMCLVAATLLAFTILRPAPTSEAGKATYGWGFALVGASALAIAGFVLYCEDPFDLRDNGNQDYAAVTVHQARNFYGTVSVVERRYRALPDENDRRTFYSGQVVHGMQFVNPARHRLEVAYYSPGSGAGETLAYAMQRQRSLKVAIIGLGAGTLANYARPADQYDFYEINPEAVRVAKTWFHNLAECRAERQRIVLGDARLKLDALPDAERYDVIVLDAFSGDSVPVHLLTREAFALYRRHLAANGYLVVHITNSYLNLFPIVRRQAEELGMGYRYKYQMDDDDHYVRHNQYVILTDDREYLSRFPSIKRKILDESGGVVGEADPDLPNVPLWTDNFSSLSPIEIRD